MQFPPNPSAAADYGVQAAMFSYTTAPASDPEPPLQTSLSSWSLPSSLPSSSSSAMRRQVQALVFANDTLPPVATSAAAASVVQFSQQDKASGLRVVGGRGGLLGRSSNAAALPLTSVGGSLHGVRPLFPLLPFAYPKLYMDIDAEHSQHQPGGGGWSGKSSTSDKLHRSTSLKLPDALGSAMIPQEVLQDLLRGDSGDGNTATPEPEHVSSHPAPRLGNTLVSFPLDLVTAPTDDGPNAAHRGSHSTQSEAAFRAVAYVSGPLQDTIALRRYHIDKTGDSGRASGDVIQLAMRGGPIRQLACGTEHNATFQPGLLGVRGMYSALLFDTSNLQKTVATHCARPDTRSSSRALSFDIDALQDDSPLKPLFCETFDTQLADVCVNPHIPSECVILSDQGTVRLWHARFGLTVERAGHSSPSSWRRALFTHHPRDPTRARSSILTLPHAQLSALGTSICAAAAPQADQSASDLLYVTTSTSICVLDKRMTQRPLLSVVHHLQHEPPTILQVAVNPEDPREHIVLAANRHRQEAIGLVVHTATTTEAWSPVPFPWTPRLSLPQHDLARVDPHQTQSLLRPLQKEARFALRSEALFVKAERPAHLSLGEDGDGSSLKSANTQASSSEVSSERDFKAEDQQSSNAAAAVIAAAAATFMGGVGHNDANHGLGAAPFPQGISTTIKLPPRFTAIPFRVASYNTLSLSTLAQRLTSAPNRLHAALNGLAFVGPFQRPGPNDEPKCCGLHVLLSSSWGDVFYQPFELPGGMSDKNASFPSASSSSASLSASLSVARNASERRVDEGLEVTLFRGAPPSLPRHESVLADEQQMRDLHEALANVKEHQFIDLSKVYQYMLSPPAYSDSLPSLEELDALDEQIVARLKTGPATERDLAALLLPVRQTPLSVEQTSLQAALQRLERDGTICLLHSRPDPMRELESRSSSSNNAVGASEARHTIAYALTTSELLQPSERLLSDTKSMVVPNSTGALGSSTLLWQYMQERWDAMATSETPAEAVDDEMDETLGDLQPVRIKTSSSQSSRKKSALRAQRAAAGNASPVGSPRSNRGVTFKSVAAAGSPLPSAASPSLFSQSVSRSGSGAFTPPPVRSAVTLSLDFSQPSESPLSQSLSFSQSSSIFPASQQSTSGVSKKRSGDSQRGSQSKKPRVSGF
ncbi:hypothetical protein CAOG_004206 [Capsaspora owczarzaki ATCC 30864]|uniref:Uncharacterized protein n=1 Tax=Capsaspora owczarzaki (strain ATCC 30864) TaxID=595528 RepID=A0A0D2VRC9_CAPO3|nr:hypothetical protein CAOG_004206 [Capsaspora owczarzaki ATCC 30864]